MIPVGSSADEPTVVALVLSRSTQAVQEVRSRFAAAGFTVGPASGPTFAVEAPAARFRDVFGVTPVLADDGGWTTDQGDEFPLHQLPDALRRDVVAVALERPAELHGSGTPHDPDHGGGQ
jgi:hypothetical protein